MMRFIGLKMGSLTRDKMIEAAEEAFGRLQALAEVSEMAASGARIVAQLFAKATSPRADQNDQVDIARSRVTWWQRNVALVRGLGNSRRRGCMLGFRA